MQSLTDRSPTGEKSLARRDRTWLVVSALLALAIGLVVLVVPQYESTSTSGGSTSTTSSDTGQHHPPQGALSDVRTTHTRTSLMEEDGWRVVSALLVPVILCGVPALIPIVRIRRPTAIASTLLIACGIVVAMFSIGLFYVPVLMAMIVATSLTESQRRRST